MTMSLFKSSLRTAAAAGMLGALAACSADTGPTVTQVGDLAYVRVINAIPDTGAMIYRFVDQIENPLEGLGLNFRQASAYAGTKVGARQLRAFIVSTTPAIVAGAPILDRSVTLAKDTYYTLLHVGLAQGDRDSIIVLVDSFPSFSALGARVGIRAVHAIPSGVGAVNVFTTKRLADALPATPAFSNVTYGRATAYAQVTADTIAARVQVADTPTTVLSALAPVGTAGTTAVNPDGGSRIAGSSLTAVAFPAGLGARATSNATNPQFSGSPAVVWYLDGRPPETVPRVRP
ncbi:MAG: DUF4397 domain-containing protein [Gemmatimonadaceae bacterium]|nr:DUF4397 domain-containing protein [Gemmatimonadaceae bacterium]